MHPRIFTPDSRPSLLWAGNRNSPEHPENPLGSASPGTALNIKGVLQQVPTNTAPSRSSEHASARCCLMQGGCRSAAEFLLKHTHTHTHTLPKISKLASSRAGEERAAGGKLCGMTELHRPTAAGARAPSCLGVVSSPPEEAHLVPVVPCWLYFETRPALGDLRGSLYHWQLAGET